ncbi:MAG: SRPBCC family protein [Verrucomicrobiota bacterium]
MKTLAKSAHTPTTSRASVKGNRGFKVVKHITINRPVPELFSFWRNFENLPRFMKHLEAVIVRDARYSHWKARAPLGKSVEWDAEIINEHPDSLIAWRSCEGADVPNAGSVRFQAAPAGRGTEVVVALEYIPPAGRLGKLVAKLWSEEPEQQVADDLRRFKWIMETGEIPTIEGQPRGAAL